MGKLPFHAPGAENCALSDPGCFFHLIGMDVAAAVPVGRSGQWNMDSRDTAAEVHACIHMHTPRQLVWPQKPTQTENIVVMTPT